MKLYLAIAVVAAMLVLATATAGAQQTERTTATRGTVLDRPAQGETQPPIDKPVRGMPMSRVRNLYGEPEQRYAPVGEPPITRWDYPGFSVFFEHDHVLHAVVPGNPPPLQHADEFSGG